MLTLPTNRKHLDRVLGEMQMNIKPSSNGAVHGEQQNGVNFRGEKTIHIFFKPTDSDRGCWVHENVFKELCFRRGIRHD